jgi:hypothetical protein
MYSFVVNLDEIHSLRMTFNDDDDQES